jgi:hypothetical protein
MRDINIAGRDMKINNVKTNKKVNYKLWIMGIIGTIIATVVGAWLLKILRI